MKIKIHRGTKEIGGSCVELSTSNSRIIVDFGMPLIALNGEDFKFDKYASLPIGELIKLKILPNIEGLYNSESCKNVDGILLSHAHLDHYGLSGYIRDDVPFYLGEATLDIINITNTFTGSKNKLTTTKSFNKSEAFQIGDFRITPYWTDHSAFDSYSFLIESDGKKVFYTGDFRKHGRKAKAFYWLKHNAPKDVDYLIMEGTNLGESSKSVISENTIENKFVRIFSSSENSNLIYTSGQNIDRLVSIFRACRRTNKILVIDFYIATVLKQLSKYASLPFPSPEFKEIRVMFPYSLSRRFKQIDKLEYLYQFKDYKITKEEIGNLAKDIVMIVRPSMKRDLDYIKDIDGGNLIYSMWDGYIAKEYTKSFMDYLEQKRNFKIIKLHSSGHADLSTLKEMVSILKPEKIIPIHTFNGKDYSTHFSVPILELQDGTEFCM